MLQMWMSCTLGIFLLAITESSLDCESSPAMPVLDVGFLHSQQRHHDLGGLGRSVCCQTAQLRHSSDCKPESEHWQLCVSRGRGASENGAGVRLSEEPHTLTREARRNGFCLGLRGGALEHGRVQDVDTSNTAAGNKKASKNKARSSLRVGGHAETGAEKGHALQSLASLYDFDGGNVEDRTQRGSTSSGGSKRAAREQEVCRSSVSEQGRRSAKRVKGVAYRESKANESTFVYENLHKRATVHWEGGGSYLGSREADGRTRRHQRGRRETGRGFAFNNRARNFTATSGNFNSYYGYRRASMNASGTGGPGTGQMLAPGVWHDPRLALLRKEWFQGKTCLDIGCNAGFLTMSMAYKFRCASMLGIDCDAALVAQARRVKRSIHWPARSPVPDQASEASSHVDGTHSADTKVYFAHQDFILHAPPEPDEPTYDTITCLSVSKWVHLNHGDEGIKALFRRCHRLLKEGGVLVLEPQPWRSYHRRRNLSPEVRRTFESIQILPDAFENETLPAAGFTSVESLGSPANVSRGFRRPLFLCRKGSRQTEHSDPAQPTSRDNG